MAKGSFNLRKIRISQRQEIFKNPNNFLQQNIFRKSIMKSHNGILLSL